MPCKLRIIPNEGEKLPRINSRAGGQSIEGIKENENQLLYEIGGGSMKLSYGSETKPAILLVITSGKGTIQVMDTQATQIKGKYQAQDIMGKSILITGGTTGIGRATAMLLASHGAKVFIFGREQGALQDAMQEIKQNNGQVFGTTADTSKTDDIHRVFEEAQKQMGSLDIFINNAALGAQGAADMSEQEIEYVIKTNLLGYILCAREAVLLFKSKGEGHIVNVGSTSAQVREKNSSVYVATKSGIEGFSGALRKEVNSMGIKVSLIEPGEVGTNVNPKSVPDQRKAQEDLKQLRAEDIAEAIYYCIVQPKRVDVINVQIRPHLQEI